jgi:GINS complex subunit 4
MEVLSAGISKSKTSEGSFILCFLPGLNTKHLRQIDKHTLHYLSTPSLRSRLSPSEISFATRHQSLLHEHYISSFLQSFPPQLRNLDDTAGGISMIDAPELDTAVFIRAMKDCLVETQGNAANEMIEAMTGEVLIAKWADVKPLVMRGDAELV